MGSEEILKRLMSTLKLASLSKKVYRAPDASNVKTAVLKKWVEEAKKYIIKKMPRDMFGNDFIKPFNKKQIKSLQAEIGSLTDQMISIGDTENVSDKVKQMLTTLNLTGLSNDNDFLRKVCLEISSMQTQGNVTGMESIKLISDRIVSICDVLSTNESLIKTQDIERKKDLKELDTLEQKVFGQIGFFYEGKKGSLEEAAEMVDGEIKSRLVHYVQRINIAESGLSEDKGGLYEREMAKLILEELKKLKESEKNKLEELAKDLSSIADLKDRVRGKGTRVIAQTMDLIKPEGLSSENKETSTLVNGEVNTHSSDRSEIKVEERNSNLGQQNSKIQSSTDRLTISVTPKLIDSLDPDISQSSLSEATGIVLGGGGSLSSDDFSQSISSIFLASLASSRQLAVLTPQSAPPVTGTVYVDVNPENLGIAAEFVKRLTKEGVDVNLRFNSELSQGTSFQQKVEQKPIKMEFATDKKSATISCDSLTFKVEGEKIVSILNKAYEDYSKNGATRLQEDHALSAICGELRGMNDGNVNNIIKKIEEHRSKELKDLLKNAGTPRNMRF